MKEQIPYNAGDYVQRTTTEPWMTSPGRRYLVMGHVWWPIEKCNAYYMLQVNEYGEPVGEAPEYIWDNKVCYPSNFKLFTPTEA